MANDIERFFKIEQCMGVKLHGKDKDGDMVFVDIEGDTAQEILNCLKSAALINIKIVEAKQ
jgi:hypothetical protein